MSEIHTTSTIEIMNILGRKIESSEGIHAIFPEILKKNQPYEENELNQGDQNKRESFIINDDISMTQNQYTKGIITARHNANLNTNKFRTGKGLDEIRQTNIERNNRKSTKLITNELYSKKSVEHKKGTTSG